MKYSASHKELQKVFAFPSKNFIDCSIDDIKYYTVKRIDYENTSKEKLNI